MKQKTCPFDGTPCKRDCPDRFPHRPEGGCSLTAGLDAGRSVLAYNNTTGQLIGFYPDGTKREFKTPALIFPDPLMKDRTGPTYLYKGTV